MNYDSPIYVAGGNTLIGAALLRQLWREGYRHVLGDEGVLPDLTCSASVDAYFAHHQPEFVFHAAGRSGGIHANQALPADLCCDNLAVNLNLIDAAHRHGVRRLLYLASSCCYPKHAPQPLRVDSLWSGPLEPTNQAFAAAKLAGIAMCQAYRQQFGCDFLVGIAANSFGPGDDFDPDQGHVISSLMARMHAAVLRNEPHVAVWGTGTPRREFLHVDDLASACLHVMRECAAVELINLAGGKALSIAELAERIREVVGYRGELVFDTSRPDGMPLKALDAAPLLATGWRPRIDFEQGLIATYESFSRDPKGSTFSPSGTGVPPVIHRRDACATGSFENGRSIGTTLLDCRLYHCLYRIRRVEEEIARVYPSDKIMSPVHLAIGQEFISVAVCEALRGDDIVFGTYRSHAYYLAKGGNLRGMIAELYGKSAGVAKGKAGSMHLIDVAAGVMGASAVVASSISQAVGYALAIQMRKERRVVVCFFGDGAVEEGTFHESLNFAALRRLPILFVCENNFYAIHSHQRDRQAGADICSLARAHTVPAERFDDQDIYRLYSRSCQAIEELRSGESGPMLFECCCYRWREHVGPAEDFSAGYRDRSEAAPWIEGDALKDVGRRLTLAERERIEEDAEVEIRDAFDYAEHCEFPEAEELYTDLYS